MVFLGRYLELLGDAGRRHPATPYRAIECWSEFVSDCRDGYDATLFEYRDDLSIRRFLQAVIDDPVVRCESGAAWFIAEVGRIDREFRDILSDGFPVSGGWGWWEQRIPRVGGEEMVRDVRELYGIDMEEPAALLLYDRSEP